MQILIDKKNLPIKLDYCKIQQKKEKFQHFNMSQFYDIVHKSVKTKTFLSMKLFAKIFSSYESLLFIHRMIFANFNFLSKNISAY